MISVLADQAEWPIVREFFELFKTPWKFHRSDSHSDVLICSGSRLPVGSAKLVLVYGNAAGVFDKTNGIQIRSQRSGAMLSLNGERLPILGECLTFDAADRPLISDEQSGAGAATEWQSNGQTFVRIGYDLFGEVRRLLTSGQPPALANIPSLEMHIALLRDLIVRSSIPLVEIPPVPLGHDFIACLTHDVDHIGIRNHKCDHTLFGFLYRATAGSAIDLCRGRKSLGQMAKNWAAALSLPLVHLGIVKDFWHQLDRYSKIEKGLTSTFFVIPKKGDPGTDAAGARPAKRAARYTLAEIAQDLQKLQSAGHEIGVHGIDAWRDSVAGRDERQRVSRITNSQEPGVRMHWLYFGEQSPATLEQAGFSYDSTVGYNQTVGYRAGTCQVFKPLQTEKLLELPMHVMDTALFYPSYLNLSPKQAQETIRPLVDNAVRFGGVLTINWHDRSIAPERLWDGSYVKLLNELKSRNAWFATAGQTVAWFRKRRSARIEEVLCEDGKLKIKSSSNSADTLPGLRIRIHHPGQSRSSSAGEGRAAFTDFPFASNVEMPLAA